MQTAFVGSRSKINTKYMIVSLKKFVTFAIGKVALYLIA